MRKGFVSMSVIYSFLLIFLLVLLSILGIYMQKSRLVDGIVGDAKKDLENGIEEVANPGNDPSSLSNMSNVRYIKDCATGNAIDGFVYWTEIKAFDINNTNLALGKEIIDPTVTEYSAAPYSRITDGIINNSSLYSATSTNSQGTNRCITVDLGSTYELTKIVIWHLSSDFYPTFQPHYNNYTEVSNDNMNWIRVLESESISEDLNGKVINAN